MKPNDELYTHSEARDACEKDGAELWEVLGGRQEWEAISKFMEGQWSIYSFWLGAEVLEQCPSGPDVTCLKDPNVNPR